MSTAINAELWMQLINDHTSMSQMCVYGRSLHASSRLRPRDDGSASRLQWHLSLGAGPRAVRIRCCCLGLPTMVRWSRVLPLNFFASALLIFHTAELRPVLKFLIPCEIMKWCGRNVWVSFFKIALTTWQATTDVCFRMPALTPGTYSQKMCASQHL